MTEDLGVKQLTRNIKLAVVVGGDASIAAKERFKEVRKLVDKDIDFLYLRQKRHTDAS